MAESIIGLYKSELIILRSPSRTVDDVELANRTASTRLGAVHRPPKRRPIMVTPALQVATIGPCAKAQSVVLSQRANETMICKRINLYTPAYWGVGTNIPKGW
jgi:hypothetical protein